MVLRIWSPSSRRAELDEQLVQTINGLEGPRALLAVRSLKEPRRFIRRVGGQQLSLPVVLQRLDNGSAIKVQALVDSGCTGSCINRTFAEKHDIPMHPLPIPVPVYNADGTLNRDGSITHMAELRMTVKDHSEKIELAVTGLESAPLFIGYEWLKRHNPNIDWQQGTIAFDRCPEDCGYLPDLEGVDGETEGKLHANAVETLEEGDRVFYFDWDGYVETNRPMAKKIAIRQTAMMQFPDYVKEFADVFSEKEFDQLPERRPWDHAI